MPTVTTIAAATAYSDNSKPVSSAKNFLIVSISNFLSDRSNRIRGNIHPILRCTCRKSGGCKGSLSTIEKVVVSDCLSEAIFISQPQVAVARKDESSSLKEEKN